MRRTFLALAGNARVFLRFKPRLPGQSTTAYVRRPDGK
jgi:hypothetical protein